MARPINPTVIRYDGATGTTWRVRVRVNGRQTTETFTNEPAANIFRLRCMDPTIGPARAVAMRDREDHASDDYVPTLGELVEKHIDGLTGIEQRTRDDYRKIAARTWLPMLGNLRVDHITRDDIARWVNDADGKSAPKTIKNAHGLLSSVLETAVGDGKADRNPARRMRLPRAGEEDVEDIRYLTHAEFGRLLEVVPEHYIPFVVTLFGTGLRFSEATALQVRDYDREAATLRVVRAWKQETGGRRVGPPKSKASRRTIDLPKEVVQIASPLTLDRTGSAWLFTTRQGNPIHHGNFYNRVWVPSVKAAELDPRPRIHDARHTHASWLIAIGVRLEVIQERLGHEDYATTRRIYGHLMPDMKREAALAASVAFQGADVRAALQRLALPA